MPDELVAQVLDGIPLLLADGREVRCRPPSLRHARELLQLHQRITAPPLEESATLAETAVDEAERGAAMERLCILFPEAVGQPDLADQLSPGDVLRVLPGFFLAGTGARIGRSRPTGTDSGAPTPPATA